MPDESEETAKQSSEPRVSSSDDSTGESEGGSSDARSEIGDGDDESDVSIDGSTESDGRSPTTDPGNDLDPETGETGDDDASDDDTGEDNERSDDDAGEDNERSDDDSLQKLEDDSDVPLEKRPMVGPQRPPADRDEGRRSPSEGTDSERDDVRGIDRGDDETSGDDATDDDAEGDTSTDDDAEDGATDDPDESVGLFDAKWGTKDEDGEDEQIDSEDDDDEDEEVEDDDEEVEDDDGDDDDEEVEDDDGDDDDVTEDAPEAKTDGEGVVGDRHKRDRDDAAYPDPDEDIGGISTPPDDEEMPLTDHIEEMIQRLAVVILVGSAATALGLLWASDVIAIMWADVIPESAERPPHVYHPLELWLTRIKVAALLGILVALPMLVYQAYLFMKPGLYPHERKYYLAAVPTSVVLAFIGMLFSYFVILPILFAYFTFYSEGSAEIAYALGETFDLVITLTGFLAITFQIPLFVILAVLMGVTTRQWLAEKRLYFWAAFAGLAFMFTMDPTFMAPIFVAITMILLFEGTLLLLKWSGR